MLDIEYVKGFMVSEEFIEDGTMVAVAYYGKGDDEGVVSIHNIKGRLAGEAIGFLHNTGIRVDCSKECESNLVDIPYEKLVNIEVVEGE